MQKLEADARMGPLHAIMVRMERRMMAFIRDHGFVGIFLLASWWVHTWLILTPACHGSGEPVLLMRWLPAGMAGPAQPIYTKKGCWVGLKQCVRIDDRFILNFSMMHA